MGDTTTQQDAPAQKDDIVRRTFGFETRAGTLNEEERSVEVVASTDALDSYGESVAQNWRLQRYAKNPVILYGHNRSNAFFGGLTQLETLPIGRAENVRITDKGLLAKLFFGDEKVSPLAPYVWEGFKARTLNAVSVGFYPHEIRTERKDDVDFYVLDDNELFEISVVPLPANADAVALSATTTNNREQLRRLAQRGVGESAHNQEPTMDPKLAELQAELTQVKSELTAKTAELSETTKKIGEKDAEIGALTTQVEAQTKAIGEKDAELTTLRAEHQEALKAKAAVEVHALVGKKFYPTEEAEQVALKLANPELYARLLETRPDLALGEQVVTEDKTATPPVGNGEAPFTAAAKAATESK